MGCTHRLRHNQRPQNVSWALPNHTKYAGVLTCGRCCLVWHTKAPCINTPQRTVKQIRTKQILFWFSVFFFFQFNHRPNQLQKQHKKTLHSKLILNLALICLMSPLEITYRFFFLVLHYYFFDLSVIVDGAF